MKLTTKQKLFLKAFKLHATNISKACEVVGINRKTHYEWKVKNVTYKEMVEDIEESMLDFGESMLYKNMKDGKESSILFFLKTRARKRGYSEREEVRIDAQNISNVNVTYE